MKNLLIGCIADDFTGASDAASFLAAGGLRTVLTSGIPNANFQPAEDVQAIVVALKTRTVPAEEAVAQSLAAGAWLQARGARMLYFKYCSTFDSTAAGNIGPVTDALMDMLDIPCTIVCPALPVNGRVVRGGLLYVHGLPLSESPMKDHPLTPMRESSIQRLMQVQSRYPCHYLPWPAAGNEGVVNAVNKLKQENDRFTLVLDHGDAADAQRIVALFGDLRLVTGGSGLLEELAHSLIKPATRIPASLTLPGNRQPRLILAGSCSDMTRRQVKRFVEAGGYAVKVSPMALISGEQRVEQLQQLIRESKQDILIYSSADEEEVRKNQCQGVFAVANQLESIMCQCALSAIAAGWSRLIVAGGETSGAVTHALGYESYYIGESVAPGVPVMQPTSNPGLLIVLKSGNFGDPDFFLNALR